MTRADAAELVAILDAAYPKKAPPATLLFFEGQLMKLEREPGFAAIEAHVLRSRFFPTLAELVEAASPAPGIALEQWGAVCEAIQRVGVYRPPPPFGDPVTRHCVEVMGWKLLCKSPNDAADRARFCELYGQVASRDRLELRAGRPRSIGAGDGPTPMFGGGTG